MAILQVIKGLTPGQQFNVGDGVSVLGRHPECDIVLDVAAVSRQHARIAQENGDFLLEDLGSRNGTFVNGKKISGTQALQEGDRIVICDVSFDFFINSPSEMLAGPMPSGDSGMALLIDDSEEHLAGSTMLSKLDVSSSFGSISLSDRTDVKLSAMIEIAQNLGKALDLEEVLSKLLDSLFRVFIQADRGFVVLTTPTGELVPKAVKHRREDDDRSARISRTIVQQAIGAKEAILSADASSDSRFDMAESITDFHIRSLMCAPLINSEGEALGVLQIDTQSQKNRFTQNDLEVLASVASQAAIAIDNAQLHEKALEQQAVQHDLQLARKVQQGLMPSEHPKMDGYHFFHFYEPAKQVGGDYYDYVPLSGGRLAVVLGDVSGKGVSAALLMAKLSGDVRYCLASEQEPAVAVSRINATFARAGSEDRFVTFVAAVLDPSDQSLTLINAGHMPPLLRHSDGTIESMGEEETGLPLGVTDDYEYMAYRRLLEPGDLIMLFTDGFSEAMNPSGELYGIERLTKLMGARAVGAAELGQHVLDDVHAFVSGHPQSDDMCLACFGRNEA